MVLNLLQGFESLLSYLRRVSMSSRSCARHLLYGFLKAFSRKLPSSHSSVDSVKEVLMPLVLNLALSESGDCLLC